MQCGIILISLAAEFYDIESVLGSGPIFGATGACLAILAYRRRDIHMIILGASAPAFAAFVFGLINVMNWGPGEATIPVRLLSFTYTVFALPFSWSMLACKPKCNATVEEEPWHEHGATDRAFE